MAWTISDLFPPWGDTGERPSDNFQYNGGDQVNEKHFDYLWDNVNNLENEIRTALQDIDADQDGIVDETDSVTAGGSLNGNLLDSLGNTVYDDTNNWVPTVRLEADTDGDSLIESYDETLLKDGGSRELDAAELAGALGSSGQVLTSDGAAASWSSLVTGEPLYGDGSDGAISRSASGNENGIITATTYEIQSGVTMTVSNGILIVLAQDSITITGTIDASGANGGGGAGGTRSEGDVDGGDGGGGGGVVILIAPEIDVSGTIDVSAGNGLDGQSPTSGSVTGDTTGAGGSQGLEGITGGGGTGGAGGNEGNAGSGTAPGGGGGGGDGNDQTSGVDGGSGAGTTDNPSLERTIVASPFSPNLDILWNLGSILGGADGGGGGSGGTDASSTNHAGGGGGGGGGSGGTALLMTKNLIENTPSYPTSAGSGGSGGTGLNNGTNGGNGASGEAGQVIKMTT